MLPETLRTLPQFNLQTLTAVRQSADLKWHATPLLTLLRDDRTLFQQKAVWNKEWSAISANNTARTYWDQTRAKRLNPSRITASLIVALERRMARVLTDNEIKQLSDEKSELIKVSSAIKDLARRSRLSPTADSTKDHDPQGDKDVNLNLFVEFCLSQMKIADKQPHTVKIPGLGLQKLTEEAKMRVAGDEIVSNLKGAIQYAGHTIDPQNLYDQKFFRKSYPDNMPKPDQVIALVETTNDVSLQKLLFIEFGQLLVHERVFIIKYQSHIRSGKPPAEASKAAASELLEKVNSRMAVHVRNAGSIGRPIPGGTCILAAVETDGSYLVAQVGSDHSAYKITNQRIESLRHVQPDTKASFGKESTIPIQFYAGKLNTGEQIFLCYGAVPQKLNTASILHYAATGENVIESVRALEGLARQINPAIHASMALVRKQ